MTVTVVLMVCDMRGVGDNLEAFRFDFLGGRWRYKRASSAWSQYAGLKSLHQTLR